MKQEFRRFLNSYLQQGVRITTVRLSLPRIKQLVDEYVDVSCMVESGTVVPVIEGVRLIVTDTLEEFPKYDQQFNTDEDNATLRGTTVNLTPVNYQQ